MLNRFRDSKTIQTIKENIFPLYLPSFILSAARSMIVPVLPIFAGQFSQAFGLIGVILAGEMLGTLISDLPCGFLLTRLGVKRSMTIGLVVMIFATFPLFFATNLIQVLLLRLISGFGLSLFAAARISYLADNIRAASRGRAVALVGGVFRIGRFVGPALGGLLASVFSLASTFLWVSLIYGLGLVFILIFMKQSAQVVQPEKEKIEFQGLFSQLKPYLNAGFGYFFLQMVRGGPSVLIPLIGANVLGLDVQTIGLVLSMSSAIDMTLFLPVGMIMDRYGRKFSILPSALMLGIGQLLLPFATTVPLFFAVGLIIGFGNGLGSGAMLTLSSDLAPKEGRGVFMSFWRLIGDVGTSGSPLAIGGLADLITLPYTSIFIAGMGLCAFLIFHFAVDEPLKKPKIPIGLIKKAGE